MHQDSRIRKSRFVRSATGRETRRAPRLLDRVRDTIRARHYSPRTEKAYVFWIRRFILFHDKRHPLDMGTPEVENFLSTLATRNKVSASTQNQAFSALLFLYRQVLDVSLEGIDKVVRAKRPQRLPVVLAPGEVRQILRELTGTPRLMAFPHVWSRTPAPGMRSTPSQGPGFRVSPAHRPGREGDLPPIRWTVCLGGVSCVQHEQSLVGNGTPAVVG